MKKTMLLLLFCLLVASIARAQDLLLTQDEVDNLKKLAEYNKTLNLFLNVWAFLGPILAALTTWLLLKTRIQKWAEEEITKKASEKLGINWNIMKGLVTERDDLLKRRANVQIAIVNHSTGERDDLINIITALNYPAPKFFVLDGKDDNSVLHFNKDFKKTDFRFFIIDNEDGGLKEEEITLLIDQNKDAFRGKIILYTKGEIKPEIYATVTKAGVGVIKQTSRFQIELDNRLPST